MSSITSSKKDGVGSSRGQAMVEFALSFILLAFVLFGVFDVARLFYSAIVIDNVAREAARYGTLYVNLRDGMSATEADNIRLAGIAEAQSSGITLAMADITPSCPSGCVSGRPVRVTAHYNLNLILGWFLPSPMPVQKEIEMVIP